MLLLNKKDLNIRKDEGGPEEVEHELIKDSVLELARTDFTQMDEVEEVPVGQIRKMVNEELTAKYKGKPVTRKQMFEEAFSDDDSVDSGDESEKDLMENEAAGSEDDGVTVDEKNGSDFEDEGSNLEDEGSEIDESGSGEEDSVPSGSESEIEDDEEGLATYAQQNSSSGISIYSGVKDISLEVAKGKAVKNQLSIWEQLLECRIKLQRALLSSNKLYQHDSFQNFKASLSASEEVTVTRAYDNLLDLLEKLVKLQDIMLPSQEISVEKEETFERMEGEEAPESSDDEKEADGPPNKRRKLEDYSKVLKKNHDKLKSVRDPVIQEWNDKTRVLTGKASSSNFSAFEQSTLKQIEQILSDKVRLVKRTQQKRSQYVPLGKSSVSNGSEQTPGDPVDTEYDPEIFDDDDFYHKLLRDFIDRKTSDVTDPNQLGRRWTEIQKLRSKMKRKVDVRATKGRKLRYTVHNKLVNFMAPIPYNTWNEEAESELFNSLFGKACVKS